MRHTPRWLSARRERGAIATIVVVLFASGVLLGCAALTVDLGRMRSERQQLQNGADAVALSVGNDCVKLSSCLLGDATKRTNLANANAMDSNTSISRADGNPAICGTAVGLPACAPLTTSPADCLTPTTGMPDQYVRVYTRTKETNGSTILPYSFASALSGQGSGVEVTACAQVGFGSLGSSGTTLPLTLGQCAWNESTANGTSFASSPPYTPAPGDSNTTLPSAATGHVTGVFAHQPSQDYTNKCGSQNGMYYSGGFGWTVEDGSCNVTFTGTGEVILEGSNGAAPPNGCKGDDAISKYLGKEVYLPIFGQPTSNGYKITGLAAFFFAGYNKVPAAHPQEDAIYKKPAGICTGNDTCFWGWFTKPIVPIGSVLGGGADLGPKSLGLIG